jgi:hypothetical protein
MNMDFDYLGNGTLDKGVNYYYFAQIRCELNDVESNFKFHTFISFAASVVVFILSCYW